MYPDLAMKIFYVSDQHNHVLIVPTDETQIQGGNDKHAGEGKMNW